MLFECPEMSAYRTTCNIGPFIVAHRQVQPTISAVKLCFLYLNDTRNSSIKTKALSLFHMKRGWHLKMGIQL